MSSVCNSKHSQSDFTRDNILNIFEYIATYIKNNSEKIREILSSIAGPKSINHEIEGAILALKGARKEMKSVNPPNIERIGVFHSSNALLYEYIIHCLIPIAYSREVVIRPSMKVLDQTILIHNFINNEFNLPIQYYPCSQREFCQNIEGIDVILFTGKYANALKVLENCRPRLFLFAGSGSNPFLITENQDKASIVRSMVENRMLNSGQDCICPNIFFIPKKEKSLWILELINTLEKYKEFPESFKIAELSKIISPNILKSNGVVFSKLRDGIVYGGNIDYLLSIIYPTVIYQDINVINLVEEWFASVFFLVGYQDMVEVREWLLRPSVLKNSMYLSSYGFQELDNKIHTHYIVLDGKSVLEVEHPNKKFGGYGLESSFVATNYGKDIVPRPYLISEEIANYFGTKNY